MKTIQITSTDLQIIIDKLNAVSMCIYHNVDTENKAFNQYEEIDRIIDNLESFKS